MRYVPSRQFLYDFKFAAPAAVLAALLFAAAPAAANPFGVSSDRFTYDGTVTVYDTLADAQNGVNARSGPHDIPSFTDSSGTYDGRDLGLLVSRGAPASLFSNDFTVALTAWYYTLTGPGFGFGNPNNTNTGFFQLYDDNGSTTTSASGSWDPSLTVFNMSVEGENATSAEDFARLWHAPNTGGPSIQTAGMFIEYSLGLTATFANAATLDAENAHWFSIDEDPIAATGHLTGIFQNQCSSFSTCVDPSVDGFYVFDFTLGLDSWVVANQDNLDTDVLAYTPGFFGATVPEPSALALLAIGLLGLSAARARRGAKRAA